jgi:hypothetical protein
MLTTINGYPITLEDVRYHRNHDPDEDRWDDRPLCWADVIEEEQMAWLLERGMRGKGNSIALTSGIKIA